LSFFLLFKKKEKKPLHLIHNW